MINKIIDGICVAINTEFGDDHEIYTETVEQGFQEPCFSVLCLNPTIEQVIGKRYFRTNSFCIHFFPDVGDEVLKCHSVAERLLNALEYISVNGDELCRGTEMHFEVVDGVLSFFVNYDMYTFKHSEEAPKMEEFEHNTDAKGV